MIKFKSTHAKISFILFVFFCFLFLSSISLAGYWSIFKNGFSTKDVFTIENYKAVIIDLYVSEGSDSLPKFMAESHKKRNIRLALITPDQQFIGQKFTRQEKKMLVQTSFKPQFLTNNMLIDKFFVYQGTDKQGQTFKIVIDISKMPHGFNLWATPMFMRMVIIISLIPLLSYSLGSYYFSSLSTVAFSILQLREGKLDTRLGDHFNNSSTDLKQLGNNFDAMAQHFEALFLAKKEMFQHVAHELRTPLARARMASTILSKEVSIKGLTDLHLLEQQMAALETLIDKILSLARLNSGSVSMSLKRFDTTELVQEIIENANYEVKKAKGLLQTSGVFLIKADKTLLSSAIENIIRNSYIHSGEGATVWVDISKQNDQVVITITDDGPGINELKLKTIFEPFIQSESSQSADRQGYGLGMAIALKVMSLHGGTISIKNVKPHGLSISLNLPTAPR